MTLWNFLFAEATETMPSGPPAINPATGLPMAGDGIGGVDIGGSPYGLDLNRLDFSPPTDLGSSGIYEPE